MRRPTSNGSGRCVGVGTPNCGLDAKSADEVRRRNAARENDPELKRNHHRATLFGTARRLAKKQVTLPTLNFLKDNNE